MNPGDLHRAIDEVLRRALSEDLGITIAADSPVEELVRQDVTTRTAVPAGVVGRATLVAKETGVFAGGVIFERILRMLDPDSLVDAVVPEGQLIVPGDIVLHARGDARALLVAERTALNLVQRMSGVASRTREAVDGVEGTGVKILDTRKTAPGLRLLDKYAVAWAEASTTGRAHDQAMVKENHIELSGRPLEELADLRADLGPGVTITCEARDPAEAEARCGETRTSCSWTTCLRPRWPTWFRRCGGSRPIAGVPWPSRRRAESPRSPSPPSPDRAWIGSPWAR